MAITGLNNKQSTPKFGLFHRKKESTDSTANLPMDFAPMTELLGYKGLTDDRDHFIKLKQSEDGYAELLTVQGQGIATMSPRHQMSLITGFQDFLRAMIDDAKFIISPFPADTSEQRAYTSHLISVVNRQMKQATNKRIYHQLATRRHYLQNQLQRLIQVEKQLSNQEFICVLFSHHRRDLRTLRDNAISWGGNAVILDKIPVKKKEEILFRINNLNTRIR